MFAADKSDHKPADFDQAVLVPFLRVPFAFYKILGRDAATLLAYLLNWQSLVNNYHVTDGTFYVMKAKIEAELGMSTARQSTILRRLHSKQYLRFRSRPERWIDVSIRYKRILRDVRAIA